MLLQMRQISFDFLQERDVQATLGRVLQQSLRLTASALGSVYLLDEKENLHAFGGTRRDAHGTNCSLYFQRAAYGGARLGTGGTFFLLMTIRSGKIACKDLLGVICATWRRCR